MESEINQLVAKIQEATREMYQRAGDVRLRFMRGELTEEGAESFRPMLNEIDINQQSAMKSLLEMLKVSPEFPEPTSDE